MTYSVPATRATGYLVTAANWNELVNNDVAMGLVHIAEATPNGAASIDFTSIPQTPFRHLHLDFYGRGDGATSDAILLQFNGDTGANYDFSRLYQSTTTPTADETFGTASPQVGLITASTAGANLFASFSAEIAHYAQAVNHKIASSRWARKRGTSAGDLNIGTNHISWRNAAAITSLSLTLNAGNFADGTIATLSGRI